jgi:hypothetical protein
MMGSKGRAALRAARRVFNDGGDGGIGTDRAGGRVRCQICNRPVRSKLGTVCSNPSCHKRALAEEG